jgi:hypothetical protein
MEFAGFLCELVDVVLSIVGIIAALMRVVHEPRAKSDGVDTAEASIWASRYNMW